MNAIESYAAAFAAVAAGVARGLGSDAAPGAVGVVDTSPNSGAAAVPAPTPARQVPAFLKPAEYARYRKARGLPGGSRAAVHKALSTRRISLTRTGKLINVRSADAAWLRNTRTRARPEQEARDDPQQLASEVGKVLAAAVGALDACREQLADISARFAPMRITRLDQAPRCLGQAQL